MKTIIKIWLAAAILLLMVGTAAADPGIIIGSTPIDNEVLPGEMSIFNVSVWYFHESTYTEHVTLLIDNPNWTYTFDPAEFDINYTETKYSNLSIFVPTDAPQGTYAHRLNATATYEPFPGFIATEDSFTTVHTSVIPEFTTIAIPVAATLGLLLLIRRRKEQN